MENEISTAETEQEDAGSNEAESVTEISDSAPAKRGRGRPPQGSKKLKVCVTDVNLSDLGSGISNGESVPTPKRGRGRPRLSDKINTKQQDGHSPVKTHKSPGRPKGSKNKTSKRDTSLMNSSPRKRGRPKKIRSPEGAAGEALPNGESDKPKKGRGRPKGSGKRKLESSTGGQENDGSPAIRRKVGRPKGSLNKKPRLSSLLDYDPGNEGKGQRRKAEVNYSEARKKQVESGERPVSRGRGRPKGSLNKKKHGKVGRPPKVQLLPPSAKKKRGRPKKPLGRPRKHPLPSPEELKKPKVWKPLGRPRKYPRVDPPEGAPPAPTRSPGRPRKSDSKKGAHLRKPVSTLPRSPTDGAPRKRGRPPGSGKKDETSRKRGRPKGSVNKNKDLNETQIASELQASDLCPVGEEEELEQNVEMMPIEVEAEEMLAEQDAGLEDVNQA
ncbi:uncharacterized protein LOC141803147 [Halichoeres trimaculatus]|uniref:uncharacterized protein LOC141803147 n=1 Tax=Halichoeres trimaculatus TaxID=147232 RepID=UPI003D9E5197